MEDKNSYNKKYYEEHKQKYKDEYNKKILCANCNKEYSKLNFSKHLKTKKHQDTIKHAGAIFLNDDLKKKLMDILNA